MCSDGRGFGTMQTGFKSTLSHPEKLLKSREPHFLHLWNGDDKTSYNGSVEDELRKNWPEPRAVPHRPL